MSFNFNLQYKRKRHIGPNLVLYGKPFKTPKRRRTINRRQINHNNATINQGLARSSDMNDIAHSFSNDDAFVEGLHTFDSDLTHTDDETTSPVQEIVDDESYQIVDKKAKQLQEMQEMQETLFTHTVDVDNYDNLDEEHVSDYKQSYDEPVFEMFDEQIFYDNCIDLNEAITASEHPDFVLSEQDSKYHDSLLFSEEAIFKVNDDWIIFCQYDCEKDRLIQDQFINIQRQNNAWNCDKRCKVFNQRKFASQITDHQSP